MPYSLIFIMCAAVFHSHNENNIHSGKYILDVDQYVEQYNGVQPKLVEWIWAGCCLDLSQSKTKCPELWIKLEQDRYLYNF